MESPGLGARAKLAKTTTASIDGGAWKARPERATAPRAGWERRVDGRSLEQVPDRMYRPGS